MYEDILSQIHCDTKFEDSGFVIHPEHNFIGASPDGLVSCSCCGEGIIEIKCPYSKKDTSIEEALLDKKFYLREVDGEIKLSKEHSYCYQVQAQLFVTKKRYCDFICFVGGTLCMDRIFPDDTILKNLDRI